MNPVHKAILFILFSHIPFTGMRLAVPLYVLHLGATPAMVGIMMALYSLLPMLTSMHLGRYMDRHGMRSTLIAGSSLLAAAVLLAALSHDYRWFFLITLVVGAAYNPLLNAVQQLIGRYSTSDNRVANYSKLSLCFATSLAVVPMITGFLIDHIGFEASFFIMCVLPLPALAMLLMRQLPKLGPGKQAPAETGASKGGMMDLIRDPALRQLYIFNILFTVAWDLFLFMTPVYGAELKLSASEIGVVVGSFPVAMFFIRFFAGTIAKSWSSRQMLLGSIVVSGFGALGFGLVASVPLLVLFALIMGLGHGLAAPTMNTLLYEGSPPGRVAEAMGLRTSIGKACQVVLPVIGGAVSTLLGVAPVYWIISITQLGAAWHSRRDWHKP